MTAEELKPFGWGYGPGLLLPSSYTRGSGWLRDAIAKQTTSPNDGARK